MKRLSVELPDSLFKGLERIKQQWGTPIAEQVRRALAAWIAAGGPAGEEKEGERREDEIPNHEVVEGQQDR